MKLKNYSSLIIVLIFSVFTTNAQKNNNQPKSNRGILTADTNFTTRLFGTDPVSNTYSNLGNIKVKGDVTLIGNVAIGKATTTPVFAAGNPIPTNLATLTAEANTPYVGTGRNNDFSFEYVDIDTDPTTFSSSSADLIFKNLDGTPSSCTRVAYAGLYWAASYAFTRSTDAAKNNIGTPPLDDWNEVKFKVPGSTTYVDLIVDKNNANVDVQGQEDQVIVRDNSGIANNLTIGYPYVCYKNVTNLIKSLGTAAGGTYTVANMRAGLGENQNGLCGGWTLVVVFENQSYPSKYITVFDGFKYLQAGDPDIQFDISGFKTVPAPFPVRARIGVAGLEGESGTSDKLNFSSPAGNPAFNPLSNGLNPPDNFFNSTISVPSAIGPLFSIHNLDRVPNSTNTLGLDIDLVDIPNPGNSIIANNATSATCQFTFAPNDTYSSFLLTFTADIIEPNMILTKVVKSGNVTLPQNATVALGQTLTYEITYQNTGNDDAKNLKITDVLPNFVSLVSVTPDDPSVTFTNTPTPLSAGTLVFSVPDAFVLKNSPSFRKITIVVQVTSDPNVFIAACSNIIKNTAKAKYNGNINTSLFNDDSYASFDICGKEVTSTNFLPGLGNATIQKDEKICGSSLTLTAPPGYLGYTWTNVTNGSPGTPIAGGNTQTLTVTASGNYNVFCNIGSPCYPINIQYNVTLFTDGNIANPVIPFANEVKPQCNSGTDQGPWPQIYLCGNQTRFINPNIANATFTWEKLIDASCPTNNTSCHIENPIVGSPCGWATVGTNSSFTAVDAGEYRVNIIFQGGCPKTFYFKVFKSDLTIDATIRNISCLVTGRIEVTGLAASGYEYSISNTGFPAVWQTSPIFNNVPQGAYNICARLIATAGLPGACTFCINKYVDNISTGFDVSATVLQPLCHDDCNAEINVQVGGANPQFKFEIRSGTPTGLLVGTFGFTSLVTKKFGPFCPGVYYVTGSNQDGCTKTIRVDIINPPLLTASVNLTKPVTCEDGVGTITINGGTGPYSIRVDDGVNAPQTISGNTFPIPVPVPNTGSIKTLEYSIKITDYNNCEVDEVFTTTSHPKPQFTVSQKNIFCYGNNTGEIKFNLVSNLGGYVLAYSIDNGVTYQSSNVFTGLTAGIKKLIVKYSYPTTGNVDCFETFPDVILTEPAGGLIASGGVSELAGCGPGNTGKVRITNPQGGTPPYVYYFTTPPPALPVPFVGVFSTVGSQTSKEAFLPVGCHTIYIQDASGCSFPMNVCLDPPPTPPTLNTPVTVYNCDGTATSTVTVNSNGGNFTYEYFLNNSTTPNPGPNPNVFTGIPCSSTTQNIKVNYTAINIPTYNNLLIENFGSGNPTTTDGIANATTNPPFPGYCFNDQRVVGPYQCGTRSIEDGQYSVASFFWRPDDPLSNNSGAWFHFKDHTSNGLDPNGRFLHVNIGGVAGPNGILYSKTINDIIPNQPINVRAYVANLLKVGFPCCTDPSFAFELVDSAGNVVAQEPQLPATDPVLRTNTWQVREVTLNPGNNTTLKFNIKSGSLDYGGNDAVIDDIEVYQRPKACATSTTFPLNIPCSLAFAAQVTQFSDVKCNGTNTGTVTIAAQNYNVLGWQYSTNAGATWSALITTPTFTIPNFPAGTASIQVRYDSSSLPCTKTLTQVIGTPTALTASATAVQATCLPNGGATITGSATGGTGAYTFQLESPLGTVVPGQAFPHAALFSPVAPGTYFVRVKDANGCLDPINTAITIDAIPALTANLSTTSDLCYEPVNKGKIVITGTGGSGTILYAIANAASGPFSYASPNSNTFPNLGPGTYYVEVIDGKSCKVLVGPIVIAPQLVLTSTFNKDITCATPPNDKAKITAVATGGLSPLTFQISLNNAPFVASTSVAGATVVGTTLTYETLTPGTVKIRVSDGNIAPNTCTDESIVYTITAPVGVTGTATPTQATCGLNNGTVTLVALTGAGGYSYSLGSPPIISSTGIYTGLALGNNYPWEITDSKGCKTNGTISVTQPNPIAGTAQIKTNYTCAGTACIEVINVSGGTPAATAPLYTYSIGGAFQPSPEFCGLTNGTYTITIKDSKDCTFITNSVTIDPLNKPIDLLFSNTAPNCPTQTASVTLTPVAALVPTTGNAPFTYSITDPVALVGNVPVGNTFNNLPPSTPITFKVVDAKGCEYSETYNFAPVTPIAVNGSSTNVQCFNSSTGSITFNVSGFSGNYNYTINETIGNTIPAGGSGLNSTLSTINLLLLPKGIYKIVVTDNTTNCTATETVNIINPPSALSFIKTVTPKTCATGGSVSVVTTGGWGGYSYTLTQPAPAVPAVITNSTGAFSNLTTNGLYTIKVTDVNGCDFSETFNIINSGAPTLTLDTTNTDYCFGGVNANAAKIVVTANGGTGSGYQYFLLPSTTANTNVPANEFPNLSPGTFTIQVKDSAGCPSNIVTVVIEPKLTVGATLVKGLDCTASPNAQYTINVANGYPSYSQQIQFNGGGFSATTSIGSSFLFTASSGAGTYDIKITDNKGCTAETQIIINPLVPVNATTTQVNVLCSGANTGSFTISPSGGTPGTSGYLVQFNGTGAFLPNNFTHSGLVAGTYTYIVRDSKNCTFAGSVTITDLFAPILGVPQPTPLSFPGGFCAGIFTPNGKICFPAITGGQAGYTITMTDGSTTYPPIFTLTGIPTLANPMCYENLDIGNYLIIITDANNCSVSYDVVITGPVTGLFIDPSVIPTTDCLLGGCIKLTASGPLLSCTTALWFAIDNSDPSPLYFPGNPQFQPATDPSPSDVLCNPLRYESIFCNLIPGKIYKFTVYSEANQCYFPATATAPVQQFSPFASTVSPNPVSCSGGADGSVNFTFSNYSSTSVTYQIFRQVDDVAVGLPVPVTGLTSGGPTQTVNNFGVLTPGICYYILFTENNGLYNNCKTASPIFCISQATTALTLSTLEIKKDACGKNIGVASGTGNGGAGGYKYRIFPSGFVPPINIPVNNATYLLFLNDPLWTSTSSFGGLTGSATPNNYVIFVKDSNGCVVSQPVSVGIEPALVLDPLRVNQCDNVTSYTINAVANGGFGIKTYSSTNATPSSNTTGIFTFPAPAVPTPVTITVTDANGCTDSKTITVNPKLNLSLTNVIQPTCATGTNTSANNGSVTANGIGGTGTYTYSILPLTAGLVQTVNVFTNLQPGVVYDIEVKDGNNCSDKKTITPVAPTPVVIASVDTLPVSCFGGSDGQITVNFAVGTNITQYTFVLDPGAGQTSQTGNNVFTNVSAGPHTIKVISSQGCEEIRTPVTVGSPTQVTLSGIASAFACPANNTVGTATVTLTGANGTPGYYYSETGLTGSYGLLGANTFTVTDTGFDRSVTYYVKDSKGCTGSGTVQIFTAKKITDFTVNQVTAISCTGPEKVKIITVVGGVGPYTYAINGSPNPATSNNLFDLANATTYSVRVTDTGTGCYLDKNYTVAPFGTYSVVVAPPAPITCFGGTSSLSFNVTGFVGAFDYQIFESASSTVPVYPAAGFASGNSPGATLVPTTFSAGVYTVKVKQTAAPECSITSNTVTITAPAVALSVKLLSNVNAFCTSPNAVVTIEGAGGTNNSSGYTYAIVSTNAVPALALFSTTLTATFTASLDPITPTWYAFVKDANNCVIATPLTINIVKDPNPTIAIIAPLGDQCDLSGAEYPINVSSPPVGTTTLPWTYSISIDGNVSSFTSNYSVPFPSTGTTTVFVTVKDKNGCTAMTAPITIYPSIGLNATITKQPTCASPLFNDGEVTVSGSGGNGIYVYSILPAGPTQAVVAGNTVFSGLIALTTYTIKVENIATGCSTTRTVTPNIPTPVTLASIPFTKVDVLCNSSATGSFIINLAPQTTTVNNNPAYTYVIITKPLGATPVSTNINSNSFTGLIAGTYVVEITSNSNCKTTQSVTITQPPLLVVPAPIVTQASCPANSNVSAFAVITSPLTGVSAVSGGTVPYTYQFSEGTLANVVQAFGTDNSHTVTSPILVPTQYFLTVRDKNGCEISSTGVTVNPFVKLESFSVTTNSLITCNPLSLQGITITTVTNPLVPSTAPSLIYTIKNILPTPAFLTSNNTGVFNGVNGLPIGNYLITVTNTNTGCVLEGPVYSVNNPNTFQANITNVVNVKCFGETNGSVQITVVDNIINSNTPPDPDNAGLFSCVITRNGNPFRTENSPTAGPFTISNLPAGSYIATCALTSTPFCTLPPVSFSITEPDELQIIAVQSAAVTCRNTGNVGDGAINVTVSGGETPYLVNVTRTAPTVYNYGNFAPGNITGLIAGTYSVTITDGTSPTPCSKPASIVILPVQPGISRGIISSNLTADRLKCFGEKDATITVTGLIGGDPTTYSYTLEGVLLSGDVISNGPQNSNDFNLAGAGYGPGSYIIKVSDGYGCTFTTNAIVITEPTPVNASLGITRPIDCSLGAEITLVASGGTPPYYYSDSLTGFFTAFPAATPTSVTFVKPPGDYKYFVKDGNDCFSDASIPVQIQPIPVLTIKSVVSTRVTCVGLNTGTITAVAQGGFDTNYTYTLYSSATGAALIPANTTGVTTGEFTGLPTGNYWVRVTSGGNCVSGYSPITVDPQYTFGVTITPVNAKCNGDTGSLKVTVTNPIGKVQYFMSPETAVYTDLRPIANSLAYAPITDIKPGTYSITVYDQFNCPFSDTFTITEPTLLNNEPSEVTQQETCFGDKDGIGRVKITTYPGAIQAGTPPYSIVSVDGSTTFTSSIVDSSTFEITNLAGGNHIVIVKDANDCTVQIPLNLDPNIEILPTTKDDYPCPSAANNFNNVTVSINPLLTASGSGYTISYSLDNSGIFQSSPIFANVPPGKHFIKVKSEISFTNPARTNTCIKQSANFIVQQIEPIKLSLTNGNLNEIIAITTGGVPPYNYDFNGVNTGTSASYIISQTDKYTVIVTDTRGCPAKVSKTFNFIDIFIPNFFTPDGDGNNDAWAPQNTYNYKNLIFYVFDRFGRKIGTFNEGEFWDGKYEGQELPSGDYWFLVKPDGPNDDKEYVGNFSLYR